MFSSVFLKKCATATALCLGLVNSTQAALFYWTDWTGDDLLAGTPFQATGTITTPTTSVGVTYTNQNGVGFYQTDGGTDYYSGGEDNTSPYTSTLVDNRPTGSDFIALQYAGTQTLTFSETITNPVFAFVSLNQNGYAFDQDFEILSLGGVDGNACGYWGCGGASKVVVNLGGGKFEYQLNSNNVNGTEPHGTIRFVGSFKTLSWRSSTNEYWNGFTLGIQGTSVEVCTIDPDLPECAISITNISSYNGHTYAATNIGMSWSDAEAFAIEQGGHLVTINDLAENTFIFDTYVSPTNLDYWIGLNCVGCTDYLVRSQWHWSSGEPVTFENFWSGQPDGGSGNDYYAVINSAGNGAVWDNYPDSSDRRPQAILEFDIADVDFDGVPDSEDGYPNIPLGGRLDTDHDGIPNKCNAACINLGMLADDDDDGDGHIDTADNCPLIANPDQLDDNNDGIGNLCNPPGCG